MRLVVCLDELVVQVAKLAVSGEVNTCLINILCHLLHGDCEPVFARALLALANYGPCGVVSVELDGFECVSHFGVPLLVDVSSVYRYTHRAQAQTQTFSNYFLGFARFTIDST